MPIINTNLENEFNLSHLTLDDDETEESNEKLDCPSSEINSIEVYQKVDKIEAALPIVWGLDSSDKELDDLAEKAIEGYKDLMELAMNIEQKYCADVAAAASSLLGHAVTAKTNKIKKKLDMVALQLKKQLADHKTKGKPEEPEELEGEGKMFDRNEILNHLLGKPQNNTKS